MTQTAWRESGVYLEDPRRRIELPGLFNLRDVGGYPVEGGGAVRWRMLLRSDALHQLDAAGTAAIAGLGLRTIVDLRTQLEVDNAPSALDGLQARVQHVSLLAGDLQSIPLTLEEIYRFVIDECGDRVAAAVAPLCLIDAVPALVHCTAGKDRTGVVIALILAVLGVPDEVIAADYALSSGYLDPGRTAVIGQLQASTGLGEEVTGALFSSPPALILDVLARVRAAAGSATGYLVEHGLTEAAVARLRAALIA